MYVGISSESGSWEWLSGNWIIDAIRVDDVQVSWIGDNCFECQYA